MNCELLKFMGFRTSDIVSIRVALLGQPKPIEKPLKIPAYMKDVLDKRFLPRRRKNTLSEPYDKHSKRRVKCVKSGRCPRCGKKCKPFYYCEYHRHKMREQYLRRKERSSSIARNTEVVPPLRDYGAGMATRPYAYNTAKIIKDQPK